MIYVNIDTLKKFHNEIKIYLLSFFYMKSMPMINDIARFTLGCKWIMCWQRL